MDKDLLARIDQRLAAVGLKESSAAKKAGLSDSAIRNLRRSIRAGVPGGMSAKTLEKLALVLETSASWLLSGQGIDESMPTRLVELKGYIGAGQYVEALDNGFEQVEAPANSHPETVAAIIRGDSMLPNFQDGWTIYWSQRRPAADMVNQLCVVQLSDGRIMVKTLRNGSKLGLWTLSSTNAADIIDVSVDWAAKIDWIKPK